VVKEGVRKIVNDRQAALQILVHAINGFRKFTDQPMTLRGSDYAHAVQERVTAAQTSSRGPPPMEKAFPGREQNLVQAFIANSQSLLIKTRLLDLGSNPPLTALL
jgi:hypothetical protein